jgi:transposase-like protein
VEDRRSAVMELLSGKASVDPLARRYGVKPETIEGWREEAVGAIDEALTRQTMKSELLERAPEGRTPSLPGRSRR